MTPTMLIESLGLFGVFLLMVPESACIPIPSEATLMTAGVGVSHGWFSLPWAVVAATGGNLAGSLLAYGLGRRRASGPRRGAGILRCERLFDRWGSGAVLVARLLPLARTFISLPAGEVGVPLGRFIAMTLAGCAVWSTALIVAGSLGWQAATHTALTAMLAVGALVLGWPLVRRARERLRSPG